MAISIIQPLTAASIEGGFDIPTEQYADAANATYSQGAVLSPDGSGHLVEATAASPTTSIAGVALQAGSDLASPPSYPAFGGIYPTGVALNSALAVTPLLVVPALPGVIFEGTLANGGNDYAITLAALYAAYGLTKDATSGYWYVDAAKTGTAASVVVVGVRKVEVVFGTTTGVRVYFKMLAAKTIY